MARVLVIGEQAESSCVFEKSFNNRHRAAMCSSHEDGIRYLAKDAFDVIVLDLQNGYSLDMSAVQKFREKAPETPLIVTSSNEHPQVIISAMKAGAFDYIVKPCTPDKIHIAIENALEKVSQLTGYTYTRTDTGQKQTGLVAQDIEKVLPEAVTDSGDYKAVAYGNMMGLIVEAIKELKAEIDSLKKS